MVKIFAEEMERILDGKIGQYQDGWEEAELYGLKSNLNKQFGRLVVYNDIINSPNNKEEAKLTLIHIATLCLLIFTRLNSDKLIEKIIEGYQEIKDE